jgi:hypothetical protein
MELKNPNPIFMYSVEKVISGKKILIEFKFNLIISKDKDYYSISFKNLFTPSKDFIIPELLKNIGFSENDIISEIHQPPSKCGRSISDFVKFFLFILFQH